MGNGQYGRDSESKTELCVNMLCLIVIITCDWMNLETVLVILYLEHAELIA